MAKKRKVFLHVGLEAGADDVIEAALFEHRHALESLGVRVAPENADEMFRAAIEITRTHKAWGYKRREVEGAWAGICRRILKAKGTHDFVLSQPLLAGAAPEQIELLVDQLAGLAVHVVVLAPAGHDALLEGVLDRWARAVRKPERLHVVEVADQGKQHVWRELGRVVGFGTASLSVAGLGEQPLTSLPDALDHLARLRRRNQTLELKLSAEKKRRRLRRRQTAA
ncbi:MAG: hypothetical protein M3237_14880 [Actinomycetota bacterium]|nr:hypothetical protein [Actinomycetota bacterium]